MESELKRQLQGLADSSLIGKSKNLPSMTITEQFQQYIDTYQKLEQQFVSQKLKWAQIDQDYDQLSEEFQVLYQSNADLQQRYSALQQELIKSKQVMGDTINLAYDIGGQQLADRIINIMKLNNS